MTKRVKGPTDHVVVVGAGLAGRAAADRGRGLGRRQRRAAGLLHRPQSGIRLALGVSPALAAQRWARGAVVFAWFVCIRRASGKRLPAFFAAAAACFGLSEGMF